jgi:hypothetical protein
VQYIFSYFSLFSIAAAKSMLLWTHTWVSNTVEGRRVRQVGPTVANMGPPAVNSALSQVS